MKKTLPPSSPFPLLPLIPPSFPLSWASFHSISSHQETVRDNGKWREFSLLKHSSFFILRSFPFHFFPLISAHSSLAQNHVIFYRGHTLISYLWEGRKGWYPLLPPSSVATPSLNSPLTCPSTLLFNLLLKSRSLSLVQLMFPIFLPFSESSGSSINFVLSLH